MKKTNLFIQRLLFAVLEISWVYLFIKDQKYIYILFFVLVFWLDLWYQLNSYKKEAEKMRRIFEQEEGNDA